MPTPPVDVLAHASACRAWNGKVTKTVEQAAEAMPSNGMRHDIDAIIAMCSQTTHTSTSKSY